MIVITIVKHSLRYKTYCYIVSCDHWKKSKFTFKSYLQLFTEFLYIQLKCFPPVDIMLVILVYLSANK